MPQPSIRSTWNMSEEKTKTMKIDDVKIGEVYTAVKGYRSGFGRRLRAEEIVTQEPERATWRSPGRKQRMVRVTWLEGDEGDTPSDPQPDRVLYPARDLTLWAPWREERDAREAEHARQGAFEDRYKAALMGIGIDLTESWRPIRRSYSSHVELVLEESEALKLIEHLESR